MSKNDLVNKTFFQTDVTRTGNHGDAGIGQKRTSGSL